MGDGLAAPWCPIEGRAGSHTQPLVALMIVVGGFNLAHAAVSALWPDPAWLCRHRLLAKDFD
jgi:hypothetical protein